MLCEAFFWQKSQQLHLLRGKTALFRLNKGKHNFFLLKRQLRELPPRCNLGTPTSSHDETTSGSCSQHLRGNKRMTDSWTNSKATEQTTARAKMGHQKDALYSRPEKCPNIRKKNLNKYLICPSTFIHTATSFKVH